MTLDPRDRLLQEHTPALMVPRYGDLAPLEKNGHRYLVADDGLWLEARRPWLHAVVPVAPVWGDAGAWDYSLPFGQVKRSIAYAFGEEELCRIQTLFLYDAQKAMPDEFAAWAVWDSRTRRLEYRPLFAAHATPGGLEGLQRPRLDLHEALAIDLHSHGALDAFFSATDDDDDRGEVKVSVVVGQLGDAPVWSTRLCLLGLFITPEDEMLEVPEHV